MKPLIFAFPSALSLAAWAFVVLVSCGPAKTTEENLTESLKARKAEAARKYEVKDFEASSLNELKTFAISETQRLLNFVEEQELYRGLNPAIQKSRREVERAQKTVDLRDSIRQIVDLNDRLAKEDSFDRVYRRYFSQIESETQSQFRSLVRELDRETRRP